VTAGSALTGPSSDSPGLAWRAVAHADPAAGTLSSLHRDRPGRRFASMTGPRIYGGDRLRHAPETSRGDSATWSGDHGQRGDGGVSIPSACRRRHADLSIFMTQTKLAPREPEIAGPIRRRHHRPDLTATLQQSACCRTSDRRPAGRGSGLTVARHGRRGGGDGVIARGCALPLIASHTWLFPQGHMRCPCMAYPAVSCFPSIIDHVILRAASPYSEAVASSRTA